MIIDSKYITDDFIQQTKRILSFICATSFQLPLEQAKKLKSQEIVEKLLGKMKASESVIISVYKNKWEAKEEYFGCLYLTDGTCMYVSKYLRQF